MNSPQSLEQQAVAALLQQTLDFFPTSVFFLDTEARCFFANEKFKALAGKKGEVKGAFIGEIIPALQLIPFCNSVLKTGLPIENRLITETAPHSHEKKSYWLDAYPLKQQSGALMGVCFILQNVPASKWDPDGKDGKRSMERWFETAEEFHVLEEETVRRGKEFRNDEHFRKYFNLGLIGIAATSLQKEWVEVNDYVCQMLGYSREELLKRTWVELTHADDLAKDEKLFGKLVRGEIDSYKMDKRYVHKKGNIIHASIAVTCIRGEDGVPDQIVALIQDITSRKLAETELANYKQHLEELVRERTRVLNSLNEKLQAEIAERKAVEHSFQAKNIALKELLSQIELEKKSIKDQILANIERILLPTVKQIQIGKPELREDYVLLLLRNLKELASSFGSNITNPLYKLTPREIEICNMIKSRLSNKEISKLLNISLRTVETHRNEIRKKLDLAHKGINLTTYLQSL